MEQVGDGEAALEADAGAFDVVILDSMLPTVSGTDVLRHAARRKRRADHRADRARDRGRPRARARARRGRLHDEAVLDGGAREPRARDPAPRASSIAVEPGPSARASAGCGSTLAAHRSSSTSRPVYLTPSAVQAARPARRGCPGSVVTRRGDHAAPLGRRYVGDEHACDVHISNLRHKIERDPRSRSASSRCAVPATSSSRCRSEPQEILRKLLRKP